MEDAESNGELPSVGDMRRNGLTPSNIGFVSRLLRLMRHRYPDDGASFDFHWRNSNERRQFENKDSNGLWDIRADRDKGEIVQIVHVTVGPKFEWSEETVKTLQFILEGVTWYHVDARLDFDSDAASEIWSALGRAKGLASLDIYKLQPGCQSFIRIFEGKDKDGSLFFCSFHSCEFDKDQTTRLGSVLRASHMTYWRCVFKTTDSMQRMLQSCAKSGTLEGLCLHETELLDGCFNDLGYMLTNAPKLWKVDLVEIEQRNDSNKSLPAICKVVKGATLENEKLTHVEVEVRRELTNCPLWERVLWDHNRRAAEVKIRGIQSACKANKKKMKLWDENIPVQTRYRKWVDVMHEESRCSITRGSLTKAERLSSVYNLFRSHVNYFVELKAGYQPTPPYGRLFTKSGRESKKPRLH